MSNTFDEEDGAPLDLAGQAIELVEESPPKVAPTHYRATYVDSRFQSLTSLITNIRGYSWNVLYFAAVLGKDDEPAAHEPGQHPVYDSYRRIEDMELKVEQPLSPTPNAETNEMEVIGSSKTYPYLRPNHGDIFFADVGDGKQGMFVVHSPTRLSIYKESAHQIQYTLVEYDPALIAARLADMELKTVEHLVFKKNLLQTGAFPIIAKDDADDYEKLKRQLIGLVDRYVAEFRDHECRSYLMPAAHGNGKVYDHLLTNFLQRIVDTEEFPELRSINVFNVDDGDHFHRTHSVWDMMSNLDIDLLTLLTPRYWLIDKQLFTHRPMFMGVRYSGVDRILYPWTKSPNTCTDAYAAGTEPWAIPEDPDDLPVHPPLPGFTQSVEVNGEPVVIAPPAIHPVKKDHGYVFSMDFYNDVSPGQSAIELLTKRAVANETVSAKLVLELCKMHKTWEPLDRFFLTPVLLFLIRAAMSRF